MPRFKSTHNIFKDFSEVYDPNWMDSNEIILPPKRDWDYGREMKIEDVDIWEVLTEESGCRGVYAAWSPYAEFYMVRVGWYPESKGYGVETYYGPGAQNKVYKRATELGMQLWVSQKWVESDELWLYQEPQSDKIFSFNNS